ncbi:hypothetical protein HKX48_002908 [Thoreauomyces humboldtii]|nr:hypothetical protein HKX48_002908 [Thoreauomyces humboldtii]
MGLDDSPKNAPASIKVSKSAILDMRDESSSDTSLLLSDDHESPRPLPVTRGIHPAVYIIVWMTLSCSVILFNKQILDRGGFPFPIFLTTWHLVFATVATRVLRKTTRLLSGVDSVLLDNATYFKAIVPIGAFFSASLIFSNLAYLHLSVAFIQMLKATTPVAVLLCGWTLGTDKPNWGILAKVMVIVSGVVLASYGEFNFVIVGVAFQACGIVSEAVRLVLIQKLLKAYKMDPLCSLYHVAPICALMNGIACLIVEAPRLNMDAFYHIGPFTLISNAAVAFALNCAVVSLIGKTSSLVMCLSGIGKDIILVFVSILIWSTPISTLQVVGYGITLAGMIWYKDVAILPAHHLKALSSKKRTLSSVVAFLLAGVLLIVGSTTMAAHRSASALQNTIDEKMNLAAGNRNASLGNDPCEDVILQSPRVASSVRKTKVLVTGGAGFIGSTLVDRLLELGYDVRVFDNLATGSIRHVPRGHANLDFVLGDIMDPAALDTAMEGMEYVFHLAAMSKVAPSLKNPDMARFCTEVNALGSWNVLDAARKHKIKKVMYAASSTYYGNQPAPQSERDAPDFITPYAASKFEGEMQMQMFNNLFGVPTVSLRLFMVYGPRQPSKGAYAIVTGVFARQAAAGLPLTIEGEGDHSRDFIHVKDIVEGLILAQQTETVRGQVINLGTGTGYTVQQVADLVSPNQVHVTGRKNDLMKTLADTCKMKKVLGYQPQREFLPEMSAVAQATMKGESFSQSWLEQDLILSAPWVMPSGSMSFDWYGQQSNLEKLLASVTSHHDADTNRIVSLLLFNDTRDRNLLMNNIYTLVTFGKMKSYIVAVNSKTLDMCLDMNLPCWDIGKSGLQESAGKLQLAHELLKQGVAVHVGDLNIAYVRNLLDSYAIAQSADMILNDEKEMLANELYPGNFFVRSNQRTKSLFSQLADVNSPASTQQALETEAGKTWVSCEDEASCKTVIDTENKVKATVFKYSHPVQCPTNGQTQAVKSGKFCEGEHLFLPLCQSVNNTVSTIHVGNTAAWFLSQCLGERSDCDAQQLVPLSWLQNTISKESECDSPIADLTKKHNVAQQKSLDPEEFSTFVHKALGQMWSNPAKLSKAAADQILETVEENKGTCTPAAVGIHEPLALDQSALFLLTATYQREKTGNRLPSFGRHIASIQQHVTNSKIRCKNTKGQDCRQVIWFIAEDGPCLNKDLLKLLQCSEVPFVYFAFGPSRAYGNAQKNAILELIVKLTRTFGARGTVHPLDDDSYVHPQGFDLLYNVRRFAYLPVHGLGPGVEYAVPNENGTVKEFHAGWPERRFPLDFNGMAWSTSIFDDLKPEDRSFWPYDGFGGETQFVQAHTDDNADIQVPCDKCATIFYNKVMEPTDRRFECPA